MIPKLRSTRVLVAVALPFALSSCGRGPVQDAGRALAVDGRTVAPAGEGGSSERDIQPEPGWQRWGVWNFRCQFIRSTCSPQSEEMLQRIIAAPASYMPELTEHSLLDATANDPWIRVDRQVVSKLTAKDTINGSIQFVLQASFAPTPPCSVDYTFVMRKTKDLDK